MAQENELDNDEENNESVAEGYPDTVWDEYVGQYVCVQLSQPYLAVTHPGQPAKVQTQRGDEVGFEFLPFPMLVGIFGIKKDQRGDVRITMLIRDPDEAKTGMVRVDLPPEMVGPISVTTSEEEPEKRITLE